MTAEAGWIAGAALIVFVWCGLRRLRRLAASPYPAALFGMAVFWVTQASLSGDVNAWRCMWASVAIAWVTVGSRGQEEVSDPHRTWHLRLRARHDGFTCAGEGVAAPSAACSRGVGLAGSVPIVLIIFGLRVFYRTIAQGTFHCRRCGGAGSTGARRASAVHAVLHPGHPAELGRRACAVHDLAVPVT